MKRTSFVIAALALSFAGSLHAVKADDAAKPAKTEKRDKRAQKEPKLSPRMKARFEELTGKPLTDDQEKALIQEETDFRAATQDLQDKHQSKQAAALGITVEQMKAADDAARKKMMEERKNKTNTAATPAGTTPATPAQ